MNGKGSKPRPTNLKKFRDNWDDIFHTPSELKENPVFDAMSPQEKGIFLKKDLEETISSLKTPIPENIPDF